MKYAPGFKNPRTSFWVVTFFAVIAVVYLAVQYGDIGEYAYEDTMLRLAPTAGRAYGYGNAHFGAGGRYDVERAEEMYERAYELDPHLKNVRHQLARIAFLRGDFDLALDWINGEIRLPGGPGSPSAYYVRGLIEGFMKKYLESEADYRTYLETDPTNWAATNDLAWVLLRDKKPAEAIDAIDEVLPSWPENPWLLNSYATALYELGRYDEARETALRANEHVQALTEGEWSLAYPGNDPQIAHAGVEAFKKAVAENIHTIETALEKAPESMR